MSITSIHTYAQMCVSTKDRHLQWTSTRLNYPVIYIVQMSCGIRELRHVTRTWVSTTIYLLSPCVALQVMAMYFIELIIYPTVHCKKMFLKITVPVLNFLCINSLWRFKHVYVGKLKSEYLKIISIRWGLKFQTAKFKNVRRFEFEN